MNLEMKAIICGNCGWLSRFETSCCHNRKLIALVDRGLLEIALQGLDRIVRRLPDAATSTNVIASADDMQKIASDTLREIGR